MYQCTMPMSIMFTLFNIYVKPTDPERDASCRVIMFYA